MSAFTDLITTNARLLAANRLAAKRLVESYGWNTPRLVPPREQPSAAWLAARDEAETLAGVRVRRHFTDATQA
jgi:hypothetical protein